MDTTQMLKKIALTAAGLLFSLQVWAVPVMYTLDNVSVSSGLDIFNVSGNFTYDSDLIVSNYDPLNPGATTADGIFTDFAFTVKDSSSTVYSFSKPDYSAYYQQDPVVPLPSLALFGNVAGADHVLVLEFSNELNTGATANVTYASFLRYTASTSSYDQFDSNNVGTALVAVPVPEPDTLWMVLAGLMLMAVMTLRKR